ncbi:hypothetical protein MMC34_004877 [Xylographa carneopallida]|nr:hypothetical protein [Xylographa carneopallida]
MPDMWLVVVSPSDDPIRLAETLDIPPDAKAIVLITKMDTIEWSEAVFEKKVLEVSKLVHNATYIPCSGFSGDNFVDLSQQSPWYARKFESARDRVPEYGTLLAAIDQLSESP